LHKSNASEGLNQSELVQTGLWATCPSAEIAHPNEGTPVINLCVLKSADKTAGFQQPASCYGSIYHTYGNSITTIVWPGNYFYISLIEKLKDFEMHFCFVVSAAFDVGS